MSHWKILDKRGQCCTDCCTADPEGCDLNSFIICFRKSKKQNAKRSDGHFFAWFRDPSNGAKLPKNRINIDTLNHRLNGGIRTHVVLLSEAYRIAQEALNKGLVFDYKKDDTPLLSDYIVAFWSTDYVKAKAIRGESITRMQCAKMLGTFNKHIKDELRSDMKLNEFKLSDMQRIESKMFDKGLSSSAICKAVECMRTALNYAYRTEMISDNIGSRLKNVKRQDKERGILSCEESAKVIKYLKNNSKADSYEHFGYLFVSVMLYAGLRNGEVKTLRADDIEIKDKDVAVLHVQHSYNRLDGEKGTKTGKERYVTIPVNLANEIIAYNQKFKTDYIFFSIANPEKPIDDGAVRKMFYNALEKALGIKEKERTERGIVLYSLRHEFDSRMVSSGLAETEIQAVIGHSSSRMTRHYYHQDAEALERQAKARAKVLPFVG